LLAFEVNGVRLASVSGTVEWEEREFELPAGENTLIWRYIKNGFGTLGLDAGWLDELRITSAPVIDTQPQDTVIPIGASAELSVVAVGAEPLTYQWYAGERGDISQPVVGAVGATFTTPALSVESRYWVRVTNDLGTTDSDAATVIVDNLPVAGDFLKAGDEDTDFVFDLSDFTDAFSDPDAGDTLIAIRVPELPDPGVLLLHSAPVAVDEAFPAEDLGSLVFRPEDNWNGEVTFTWIANDGLLESETPGVVTLRVDPVNDPPSVLAPVSVLAEKKIGVRINGIDVADPDAGLADVTVTISAGHGTLTIGEDTAGGLTASEINGNGTTDLELTGNLGAINTSLSVAPGMVYLNKLNFVGEDVLSITIDDEGNAGSGGPLDATEDVEISVTGTLYDVWLIENFDATDLEDPQKENLVWGDKADPDNDRLLNLVESFMGLDPRLRDDARFPRIENAGAALRFVYRRSKNAPGVGGTAEWSIDAVGWSSDGIVETITEDLGDAEVVEAPVPVGGEGAIFMRLRITR
jgi:hypothetical protein